MAFSTSLSETSGNVFLALSETSENVFLFDFISSFASFGVCISENYKPIRVCIYTGGAQLSFMCMSE